MDDTSKADCDLFEQERAARMAQLEGKLKRQADVGVLPFVAAVGLLGALVLLFTMRSDIAYLFSPTLPISLGVEGGYQLADTKSNRYVEIHGAPTALGAYWMEAGVAWVAVGLLETPVLVARKTLATERFVLGEKPPPPDARSFAVRGRLLARADAAKYQDAFAAHDKGGEVAPKWILIAESRPGADVSVWCWSFGLTVFAIVNGWLLFKGLVARSRGAAFLKVASSSQVPSGEP
jgi:hypothetical protein